MDTITMTVSNLRQILLDAEIIGRNLFLADNEPEGDYITRPQVLKMMKLRGIEPKKLSEWIENHDIQQLQTGKNGTRKFKKSDLLRLFMMVDIVEAGRKAR